MGPPFQEVIAAVVASEARRIHSDMLSAVWAHDKEREARWKPPKPVGQALFHTRVELLRKSVRVRWKKIGYVGPANARRRYDTYLQIGKRTLETPITEYREAKPWERDLIAAAEQQLVPLRRRAALLGNLSRLVTRALGANEGTGEFDSDEGGDQNVQGDAA